MEWLGVETCVLAHTSTQRFGQRMRVIYKAALVNEDATLPSALTTPGLGLRLGSSL